jgi:diguanylate cyclase (GGDEF)-like protein
MREIDFDNSNIIQTQNIHTSINSILLIEDQQPFVDELTALLTEALDTRFELVHCARLDSALERLCSNEFSLIITDLFLPDAQGPEVYSVLNARTPNSPIIILIDADSETVAVKAIQLGAQEYIIKSMIDAPQLRCVIKYALEQKAIQAELNMMALIDRETGLYNRPSFLTLTHHYLKLADRAQRGLIFLYIRFKNLWNIDVAYGSHGIEKALVDATCILKQTFRRSDILSRCTEDEFAVVALEARKDSNTVIFDRLQHNLDVHNSTCANDMKLKFAIGMAYYDPGRPVSLAELVARARRSQCSRDLKECQ